MDPEDPVPDTERGPYAWERYHANTAGLGAGFYGTVEESQEAYDRFQDACEQRLVQGRMAHAAVQWPRTLRVREGWRVLYR